MSSEAPHERIQSQELTKFCLLDVGSTTTKAILFQKTGRWKYTRAEAPTTVEKPFEDVTFGVLNALRTLEQMTGQRLVEHDRPTVACFSTSSAGGGLAIVVAGLVRDVTASSAERVALGAGAIIQDIIALDDGRTPYKKVELLKTRRPDMVLLAGGFEGGAVFGPVFLAELLEQSDIRPKLSPTLKLPVIYAGNTGARKYVEELLGERFLFCAQPNIRPASSRENLEPARNAIHDVFMDHVMSRAPGYERYSEWVAAPIMPTPAAVAELLSLVSADMDARLLAIDIGGATTDIFTAERGKVFRTVSANLGMSYSILNVVKQSGLAAVRDLLGFDIGDTVLYDLIGNKFLHPTSLPETPQAVRIECAVASLAIREAVREHFKVLDNVALSRSGEALGWSSFKKSRSHQSTNRGEINFDGYDLVVGSGGKLSHSPRDTAAAILINALNPARPVDLAVDSVFMFPQLGVLARSDRALALELFYDIGLVQLGRLIPGVGKPKPKTTAFEIIAGDTRRDIPCGEVAFVDAGGDSALRIKSRRLKVDSKAINEDIAGGRLIVDARGRPEQGCCPWFLSDDYEPTRRDETSAVRDRIFRGRIIEKRHLAIAGEVFVAAGDTVGPDVVIARSTRVFRRPFFMNIAERLGMKPEDLSGALTKQIGDAILPGDILAEYKPSVPAGKPITGLPFSANILAEMKSKFSDPKRYRSQVSGVLEKILPNGTVIVRERLDYAKGGKTINVVEELGIAFDKFDRVVCCEVGQDVEQGQVLASLGPPDMITAKRCQSPVRGRVREINTEYGLIILEPMLEELQVDAWVPGKVQSVSDRGAEIELQGTMIPGVWGTGPQVHGPLRRDTEASGAILVRDTVTADDLARFESVRAAGLIVAGLHLGDWESVGPSFSVVVTGQFGAERFDDHVREGLSNHEGRQTSLDPTTQLRAGVIRPRIILPDTD